MMQPSNAWKRGLALASGLMLLPGAQSLLAGGPAAEAVSVRILGDVVELALQGGGSTSSVSGVVVLLVRIDGSLGSMSLPFTISRGQKTFVHVPAAGAAVQIIQAGVIVDDGTPF
jgi:hypothetical protein